MTYSYTNNTNSVVVYRFDIWQPGDTICTDYPVPDNLGLTCEVTGNPPDPVLFHDNIILQAGENSDIPIPAPAFSHNVSIDIRDMSLDSGVECSFGSKDNIHIPIDARGFNHVLAWELCSHILLFNTTDTEAVISITVVEEAD